MLKDLRHDMARKLERPPYVIFQDVSLEQMATIYPINEKELLNIQGVGAGKAKRYGQPFCDLIKKYCEENDIVRPEEYRVKTVAKKSMQCTWPSLPGIFRRMSKRALTSIGN